MIYNQSVWSEPDSMIYTSQYDLHQSVWSTISQYNLQPVSMIYNKSVRSTAVSMDYTSQYDLQTVSMIW